MRISAAIGGLLVLLLVVHAVAIGILMALERRSPLDSRAKAIEAIVISGCFWAVFFGV